MSSTPHQRERPADMAADPITASQRRALFAAGRIRGLGADALRDMTPRGSISRLTRQQAAALLERLNEGTAHAHPRPPQRSERRPKGIYRMATDAQRRRIEALRIDLGWTPERLKEWLGERHHKDGRPMTKVDSTIDAAAVIELLKSVVLKAKAAGLPAGSAETQCASSVGDPILAAESASRPGPDGSGERCPATAGQPIDSV